MDGRAGSARFLIGSMILFVALVVAGLFYVSATGNAPTAKPSETSDIARTPAPAAHPPPNP